MEIQMINEELLRALRVQAAASDRLRQNLDLRTTAEDGSQRMLNMLMPGTKVAIHRHEDTTETVVCLRGRLDMIFYQELPNMDAGGPGREFVEFFRTELCPAKGNYGIQIPVGVWHTIDVKEESCIFEAKDGAYVSQK